MKDKISSLLGTVKNIFGEMKRSKKIYIFIVTLVAMAVLPFAVRSDYIVSEVLTLMLVFAIYASSWNLLAYSGQGSLGHAAFLGIGGFASALFTIRSGLPPLLGLFVGSLLSMGIGLLIGLACVRLKAWFLAMVTFGFSVIAVTLISQFDAEIGGITGFTSVSIAARGLPFYFVTFAFAAVSIFVMIFIMKSKTGLAFKAIRENEKEANMIGINTAKYKLLAFVLSTFFAGLAGGLYVMSIGYVHVSVFQPYYSFLPLMMCVIGGLGTIPGPLIGSVIIVSIESYLPKIDPVLNSLMHPLFPAVSDVGPPLRLLGLGLFLVIVVIFAPKGIASLIPKVYNYFTKTTTPKEEKKK